MARPSYDVGAAWIMLFAGTAGCLLLFISTIPDMYYQSLYQEGQIGWDAAAVGVFALLLWIAGGWLIYFIHIKGLKSSYVLILGCAWIFGSIYNIFWFAIRSV
jgi:hypothetical protein